LGLLPVRQAPVRPWWQHEFVISQKRLRVFQNLVNFTPFHTIILFFCFGVWNSLLIMFLGENYFDKPNEQKTSSLELCHGEK
jgi:hypothetical protein